MSVLLVTIDTPNGPLDLSIPSHLEGGALLAMLAPTLGTSAGGEGWQLSTPDRAIDIGPDQTLAEAGVLDGAVLHLEPIGVAAPPPVDGTIVKVIPLERSTRVLPDRVPTRERITIAIGALLGAHVPHDATGIFDRLVKAWEWTDHSRRLEWLASRPRLHRTVIVGVVGHRSTEVAQSLASTLTRVRHDRIVLIADQAPFQHSTNTSAEARNVEAIGSGLRRANVTSIERDALFARTAGGALLIPLDRSAPPPDLATFRRLLDSLASHAGVVIIDCGTSLVPFAATTGSCDQIICSTTGTRWKVSKQTIVASWGDDELEGSEEPYACVRFADDPVSVLELTVVAISGWAHIGAATPVPLGL